MKLEKFLLFETPAKINLNLQILYRRDDGFHQIQMDLIPVSLFDRVLLSPPKTPLPQKLRDNFFPVEDDNLLFQALSLLEKHKGIKIEMVPYLEKNIPIGAGLGGGSGNAAGLLVMLNTHFQLSLNHQKLRDLGLTLGADVPFFISPKPCHAQGRGEKLTPIKNFPKIFFIIIDPGFSISTKEAYQNCSPKNSAHYIQDYSQEVLHSLSPQSNDFWSESLPSFDVLYRIREQILSLGAKTVLLSGSGSSLIALTENAAQQNHLKNQISPYFRVFPVTSMNSYIYFNKYL